MTKFRATYPGNPIVSCKLINTAAQTGIVTSTWTKITVPTAEFDPLNIGASSAITIPRNGRYWVRGYVGWAGSAASTQRRLVGIGKNWTAALGGNLGVLGSAETPSGGVAGNTPGCAVIDVYELAAGDVITLLGWQNSAANLSTFVSTQNTTLGVEMVCAL